MASSIDKSKIYKKPIRFFEEEGLVEPSQAFHVEIENIKNTKNFDIKTMVDQGRYFSIFAPRQSGKTTFFRDLSQKLEKNSTYITILLNFEEYSDLDKIQFYDCVQKAFQTQLINRLTEVNCQQLEVVNELLKTQKVTNNISLGELFEGLNEVIQFKKIVIFIDEFDGIPLAELGGFLTTLRRLYQQYKGKNDKALYSIGLVGIRNVTKLVVGGVSPFNIADQVTLPSFGLKEIRELYSQYTQETNQSFLEEAVNKVFEVTAGQPWLVNRLGSILTLHIKPGVTESITGQDVEEAKEFLLRENNNHFDNLWEKLKKSQETFINLATKEVPYSPHNEDQSWLLQYGLIKEENGIAIIANPIYKNRFLYGLSTSQSQVSGETATQKLLQEKALVREKVFISYSHKDIKWVKKVQTHLEVLESEGIMCNLWDDSRIKAGMKWREEIATALQSTKVAILLVSTDFLASDFIRKKELPPLLDAVEKEGAVVLPLILKPCRFTSHPRLSQFQTVNDPQKPLSELSEDEQDKVLLALMDRIAELVKGTAHLITS